MDIFVEQLVVRRRTGKDYLMMAGCVAAALLICFFVPMFLGRFLGGFTLLLCVGLVYLLYNIMIGSNLEYEYSFTNGAMDVDKIIAAKRRKRVTSLNARDIEMMGTTKNPAFDGYMKNSEIKKVYACSAVQDEGVYFVLYSEGGKRKLLLFNPEERIKDGFRRLNPQKVFLTD